MGGALTKTVTLKVDALPPNSPYVGAVRKLWRANSATLGFFPDGAFAEYAMKSGILCALTADGDLAGYLLFRVSRWTAVIVHLCVDQAYRGSGIAHTLVQALKERTKDCVGIRLSCRTDFPANEVWARLGFEPRSEREAREPGKRLKVWWYDYGHPDLFSQAGADLPVAVLDANVFFDLQDPETPKTREAKALAADWLQDCVKLAISPEMFLEIDRQSRLVERSRRRQFADRFTIVRPEAQEVVAVLAQLATTLLPQVSTSDRSDARHLANAIASGATYFVTRDGNLLKQAELIFDGWGVTVIRPCQLVALTDEELNAASYQPSRLAGSQLRIARLRGALLDAQVDFFLASEWGERKAELLAALSGALSNPKTHSVLQVSDAAGNPLALMVKVSLSSTLQIPLLRVRRGPLASTLARHLVWGLVRESGAPGLSMTQITDWCVGEPVREALAVAGFASIDGRWQKYNVPGLYTWTELADRLAHLPSGGPLVTSALGRFSGPPMLKDQLTIERSLWPAKITDGPLQTFIVPVQPHWAMHLFDEASAMEDLFGAEPHLILSAENVYYRSAKVRYPTAPSRVLWYVTHAPGFSRAMHLVGASVVTSVHVGAAKDLYRRFRRLGVYSWSDVKAVAKGDPAAPVLAFTFGGTELFRKPVPWLRLREVLRVHMNRAAPIQAPLRVAPSAFADLYSMASDLG